jgi:hypothetical protein
MCYFGNALMEAKFFLSIHLMENCEDIIVGILMEYHIKEKFFQLLLKHLKVFWKIHISVAQCVGNCLLLEDPYFSCPVCGKLFRKEIYLKDHLNELKKNDSKHKLFFQNKIIFKNDMNKLKSEKNKFQEKPMFGRINIRASKK